VASSRRIARISIEPMPDPKPLAAADRQFVNRRELEGVPGGAVGAVDRAVVGFARG
jgi:hypothetical protein